LTAASEVKPDSTREAIVIGGIIQCFIRTGHFKPNWVQHFVPQQTAWFEIDIRNGWVEDEVDRKRGGETPDFREPTTAEIREALRKLMDRYDPPRLPAAA
jgi:hypothetical protein